VQPNTLLGFSVSPLEGRTFLLFNKKIKKLRQTILEGVSTHLGMSSYQFIFSTLLVLSRLFLGFIVLKVD
jgi:hypothetical protein